MRKTWRRSDPSQAHSIWIEFTVPLTLSPGGPTPFFYTVPIQILINDCWGGPQTYTESLRNAFLPRPQTWTCWLPSMRAMPQMENEIIRQWLGLPLGDRGGAGSSLLLNNGLWQLMREGLCSQEGAPALFQPFLRKTDWPSAETHSSASAGEQQPQKLDNAPGIWLPCCLKNLQPGTGLPLSQICHLNSRSCLTKRVRNNNDWWLPCNWKNSPPPESLVRLSKRRTQNSSLWLSV